MKYFFLLFISLILSSNTFARVDIIERNLCNNAEYSNLCENIIGKKLMGKNTIIDFIFDKGKVIGLVDIKSGENISLLNDPDPSYVANYSGAHIVYESGGDKFITETIPSSPIEYYLCDIGCKNIKKYFD
mgnify:FL=1